MPIFADDAPVAFSGTRLDWRDIPRPVRRRISEMAGAQVTAESAATSGFSPGYAAILEFADGSEAFVKAVSSHQNPDSPNLARQEIEVNKVLPRQVKAPELLWSHDDGEWVVSGFAAIHGYNPPAPWDPADLERALGALAELSEVVLEPTNPIRKNGVALEYSGWASLAALEPTQLRTIAQSWGEHGNWAVENLDLLRQWEDGQKAAFAGDRLAHADLRADNIMFDHEDTWIIDWVWAAVGSPWADLALMMPSITLQGGGSAQDIFWSQPQTKGVDPEQVRAAVSWLTAFFLSQSNKPAPEGIPNLRAFQLAQGVEALKWLRELAQG